VAILALTKAVVAGFAAVLQRLIEAAGTLAESSIPVEARTTSSSVP
jgi:hypothetical protein